MSKKISPEEKTLRNFLGLSHGRKILRLQEISGIIKKTKWQNCPYKGVLEFTYQRKGQVEADQYIWEIKKVEGLN